MTRKDYDTEHLIELLTTFKLRHPNLEIIMEPGSAFAWQTGVLVSTVTDIVENHGIRTAILDVSFACHMPDCLEMPYKPAIRGSKEPATGLACLPHGRQFLPERRLHGRLVFRP